MPKTASNKSGKIVVVRTADGNYIYRGPLPSSGRKVDVSSPEYKSALREYNIHVKFNGDGSVSITKGGLYDRKRTFASVESFQKDANARLDKIVSYYNQQESLTRKGRISQISAENLKSSVRNDTPNALKKFSKHLEEDAHRSRVMSTAAKDMKNRLSAVISEAKKKKRNK